MWKFNKKLAPLTYRLYSSSGPSSPLHGKKKLPQNLKFVVLNPTQSGLVKNDQKQPRHRPSKKRSHKETGDNNLDFGSKLLVFEKQNSLDSALNSIRLKKPTSASLPSLEYNALLQSLTSSYNRYQLREFISTHQPDSSSHLTHWKKSKLSQYIIEKIWNCQPISTPTTPTGIKSTSLTFQFDSPREIFLLLITQNGKILTNFNKLGLTFIISIQDNELTVKGSPSLLKYAEISLNKIWSNITHENVRMYSLMPSKDVINLIQKETHTFFEYLPDLQMYKISALSPKKISMAKVFLLNAVASNPNTTQHHHTIASPALKTELYPFNNTLENLDWLNKSQDWARLQSVVPKNCTDLMTPTENATPELTDAQIWFEIDEFDNIVTTSMRPLLKLQENSVILRTPQCQTDYKITSDYIQDLLPDFDQTNPDAWLSEQKGLQEFLLKSHWKLNKYQNLMKKINISLPDNLIQQYQLTDILTHRVLNLRFPTNTAQDDKYIIQYSDISRGFLNNGSYRQLDFINVNPSETSLKTFINDVLSF
ncbi:Sigma-like sequence protein 1, mitochondrial [Saccharomyces cerevisiae]|nr:Sigma-like sequence protein 1, mitochondrial [Saccharomyces cerevisiae]